MPSRVLAIGDIHGCLSNLDGLLAVVAPTHEDRLVFLGDYVDRGPDSAGVLRRLTALTRTHQVTALLGNHEQMMLAARSSRDAFADWVVNGGDATLVSYAGSRATIRDVLPEHWSFLETGLQPYFETETHLFVHANAYPDMPLSEQPDYMLRWERFEPGGPHESGKILVCGHTPQKSGRPCNLGYALCIDTNACRGGVLTCLDTTTGRVYQADGRGRVSRSHVTDLGAGTP